MKYYKNNLDELEKIAVHYHVLTGFKDWAILYQLAKGRDSYNNLKPTTKGPIVSRWKNSEPIQEEIKKIKYETERRKEEQQQKEREIIEKNENRERGEKTRNSNKTNFLDRDEFLQFLNDKANDIQDDKLRNDILKMLSDNLRYKDTERDENNEIQRFYIPLTCKDCELYKQKSNEML